MGFWAPSQTTLTKQPENIPHGYAFCNTLGTVGSQMAQVQIPVLLLKAL